MINVRHILVLFRGRIIGAIFGVTIALLLVFFGLWQTLFIILCGSIGYYVGLRFDNDEDFRGFLERILPPID